MRIRKSGPYLKRCKAVYLNIADFRWHFFLLLSFQSLILFCVRAIQSISKKFTHAQLALEVESEADRLLSVLLYFAGKASESI